MGLKFACIEAGVAAAWREIMGLRFKIFEKKSGHKMAWKKNSSKCKLFKLSIRGTQKKVLIWQTLF